MKSIIEVKNKEDFESDITLWNSSKMIKISNYDLMLRMRNEIPKINLWLDAK